MNLFERSPKKGFTKQASQYYSDESIAFRGPMIRAILNGRKTVFRIPTAYSHEQRPFEPGKEYCVLEPFRRHHGRVWYEADYPGQQRARRCSPPSAMPLNYSRISIRIGEIRAETLKSIKLEDFKAEGFPSRFYFRRYWNRVYREAPAFQWEQNPIVWVINFTRTKPEHDMTTAPQSNKY